MFIRPLHVTLSAIAFLGLAAPAHADLYVDRDSVGGPCSDARSAVEVSAAKPLCSTGRAVALASSGETVFLRRGSYPEIRVQDDHRRAAVATFRPYGSESVTVAGVYTSNASHLRFEGFRLTRSPNINHGSSSIQLVRNDISPERVQVRRSSDVLIEANDIHDITSGASFGIWVDPRGDSGPDAAKNLVIRGNSIRRTNNDPIQMWMVENAVVEGNRIEDAHPVGSEHTDTIHTLGANGLIIRNNRTYDTQDGLMFTDLTARGVVIENNEMINVTSGSAINAGNVPGMQILGNTFWGTRYGVLLRSSANGNGIVMRNNIADKMSAGSSAFASEDYNLIASGSRYGAHDLATAPRFVNPAGRDYELAAGSAGIDAGTSELTPAKDRMGRARHDDPSMPNRGSGSTPYADLGSLERSGSVTSNPSDTTPPDTAITVGPAGSTGATGATFEFSSSEAGAQFQCSLDGSPWSACTSPRTYTGLAYGGHSFAVRAVDAAGNVDSTPATRSWSVTAPPYVDLVRSGPGLVSYWRLGEAPGSMVAADAAGANAGRYGAGVTLGAPGALASGGDTAVLLDGLRGHAEVPDSASLDTGDTLTLEAWVKRDSAGAANRTLFSKGANSYVLKFQNDRLVFRKHSSGDIATSTIAVTDTSAYHHVVATKSGSAVKIYIDGVDRTGTVRNRTLSNTSSTLLLGAAHGPSGPDTFWNGLIDEAAVYRVAMSADQVRQHYQAGR